MSTVKTVTLNFTNSQNHAIQFHLEPWGEIHEMPGGATIVAIAYGEECDFHQDALKIEYSQDIVTLYGITGSTITLFQDGKELYD